MLSVISNSSLVIGKLIIGLLIGSVSVISEAIHSGVDLLAAIIALFAVRTAGKPADEEHPFGHGKIENISGTIEALLIFFAAAWIVFEAVKKLMHPEPMEEVGLGMIIMLVSALANIFVSNKLFKVGKETDSVALQADAWHLRTDVWTSFGVMAGLTIIFVGGKLFPGVDLKWVDPVAAICVAMLIVKAAYELTVQSGKDLLDAGLDEDEVQWIRDYIVKQEHPVAGYHRLRTRKSGSTRFVEFHLIVESDTSVEESHEITEHMTKGIQSQFSECWVSIHVEPVNPDRYNAKIGRYCSCKDKSQNDVKVVSKDE